MFNTDALETVVQQNSKEIAIKAVTEAKTVKLLIDNNAVTTGVKGSANINKMDADVVLQDGSTCGRTPLGSTFLSGKVVVVKPLKDIQNFCTKALYDTYFAQMLAKGQDPEGELMDTAFVRQIMDMRAARVSETVEKLVWQGDTSLSGSNNMRWIDGFIKQLEDVVPTITPTGTSLTTRLQSIYTGMPISVRKASDFRIFIGQDLYDEYLIELANANIFRPSDDMSIRGTMGKFEIVPGLDGTDVAVAARISDLHLGIDGTDDIDKAVLRYSVENEQWYMDFHFAVGVAAVYPENIGFVRFA